MVEKRFCFRNLMGRETTPFGNCGPNAEPVAYWPETIGSSNTPSPPSLRSFLVFAVPWRTSACRLTPTAAAVHRLNHDQYQHYLDVEKEIFLFRFVLHLFSVLFPFLPLVSQLLISTNNDDVETQKTLRTSSLLNSV